MIRFITVSEEMRDKMNELNRLRKNAAVKKFETDGTLLSADQFVMVRVSGGYPRMGYLEAPYRYIKPALMDSPIVQRGDVEDYSSFDLKYLRARKTLHWTLNSVVSAHSGGSFSNRDFVIIEPFKHHVDDDNLVRLAENDTYFLGDIKLSSEATILVSKEKYEKLKNNDQFKELVANYSVIVYDGDREIAFQYVLQEKGYIFGYVNAWGWCINVEDVDERKFMELLIASRKSIKELAPNHAFTEEYKEEKKEERENMLMATRLFYENIATLSGIIDGRNTQLIEKLRKVSLPLIKHSEDTVIPYTIPTNRSFLFDDEDEDDFVVSPKKEEKEVDYYSPENYQIPDGFNWYDYCVLRCKDEYLCVSNKDAINLIGLEVIKKATDITNQLVLDQVKVYRDEKDEELKRKSSHGNSRK